MAKQQALSPEQESRLVDQVQRGDRGALGDLLSAYHKRVFHVCLRMVSNADDAAELTQEALLRAIKHIEDFKGNSRFGTWLMRIAMNLSISHLRKSHVRSAMSLEHQIGNGGEKSTSLKNLVASGREPAPGRGVEIQEDNGLLAEAIAALEESLRQVLVLRDLEDMNYQSIAETLALPIGTVKSRLFRARLALRQALDPKAVSVSGGSNG